MADTSPLLEGGLPYGLKPGASYVIKILSNPEDPKIEGVALEARRSRKNDIAEPDKVTFASVHKKDVGVWKLSPGTQPGTVVLRLVRAHDGQKPGWCLAGSDRKRHDDLHSNWAVLEENGEAEWLLEPAGDNAAAEAYRIKAISGGCAGWYLGARAGNQDYRAEDSWWAMMHQPGEQQEAVWGIQELTFIGRLKILEGEAWRYLWALDRDYEMIALVAAFFVGYYLDVSMEIYSAVRLFQDASSFKLGLAMVAILFTSPLLCWLLLWANNLEDPEHVPWYLAHIMPALEVYDFVPRWRHWRENSITATYDDTVQPLPLKKSPALIWLPVCKAAFGSSMTTLFKVYGTFLVARDFLLKGGLGHAAMPTGLFGVFASVVFSCASMGNSMVSLSNYGSKISMTARAFEIAWRSVEVASRVGTVAMLGVVFVEVHSIIAILLFDLVLQFALLLVHPASRVLMRNEMSLTMLLFWAFLMILCAPPRFIPQLEDLHPAYYLIRTLELGLILALCGMRCGWLGVTAGAQGAVQEALCEVANPLASDMPFWSRAIIFCTYLASALVPVIWLVCQWQDMRRKALWRVTRLREEQSLEASRSAGCGEEPMAYGELLYLRAGSLQNRFICVAGEVEDAAKLEEAVCRHYTTAMVAEPKEVAKAGWRVFPSGEGEKENVEDEKEKRYIRFGDLVKLSSEMKDGLMLSGGRRGMNMYATTGMIVEDLRMWPFDYDIEEHYTWRVCAISSEDGVPDSSLCVGKPVGLSARFALQAMPKMWHKEEIFLSSCRGTTTAENRTEVWTVSARSRPAMEDNPQANSWPSFELFAQRKLVLDSGDVVKLTEALHQDNLRRGRALVLASRDEDIMMMNFMAQSGVPMWVTDENYLTPLHHFILGYARETQKFHGNHKESEGKEVRHKIPRTLFENMLHSGLPHLELGAMRMYTPFHFAALLGQRDLCDLLLEADADVNAADSEGWTALHDAVLYDHRDMLCYLLGCEGLDPNAPTFSGVTPLDLAQDDEVRGWLAATGARARGGEAAPAEVPVPAPPEGKELKTKFEDPREEQALFTAKCNLDNQVLGSKELAIRDESCGGACCMNCSRAGWNGFRSELCPVFKCPTCSGIHAIPYGDSLWDVCWACRTCNAFPCQARLEPGKLDYSGHQARALFEKLDADGNSRLSKEEFNMFFQKFAGQGEVSLGEQGGKTLRSSYADEVFKRIDTNDSGDLSFEEFLAFFQEPKMPPDTKVKVVSTITALDGEGSKIEAELLGVVLCVDEDGDMGIEFQNGLRVWVAKRDVYKLEVIQEEGDKRCVEGAAATFAGKVSRMGSGRLMRRRSTFSKVPCLESCLLLA